MRVVMGGGGHASGLSGSSAIRPEIGGGWHPQVFSHVISSNLQIEHLNAAGGIAVDFARQTRSPVHLEFEGGKSRRLCIWSTSSRHGFRSTPKDSADLFTLRFVTSGSMVRNNVRRADVISRVDFGTFVDFEGMRDEEASADFSAVSTTLSRETIAEAARVLDGDHLDAGQRFLPFAELKTIGLRALRQTVASLHSRLRAGSHEMDLLAPMLEELIVYQLLSVWPRVGGVTHQPRARAASNAVGRAVDYMEANLARRITLAETASATGVGVRALQMAFRREVGCSPVQYLINRRLDRVHEALKAPDGQAIGDVATRWGFVHLSDFSRRYRARFGESPSKSKDRGHARSSE